MAVPSTFPSGPASLRPLPEPVSPASIVPFWINPAARSAAWVFVWNAASQSMAALTAAVARSFVKPAWTFCQMNDRSLSYDVIIVGAGPAGLSAACAAAESGARVAIVDESPWLGGQIWRGQGDHPSNPQAKRWLERFRHSGVLLLDQTTVIASPEPGLLLAERDHQPLQLRFQKLVLATGA